MRSALAPPVRPRHEHRVEPRRLTVPVGHDPAGLPIGLQPLARPLGEPVLLRVGHASESTRPARALAGAV
ncbi:hypothetical protein AB0A71_32180 [Kitasatospora aureofaciens]